MTGYFPYLTGNKRDSRSEEYYLDTRGWKP